MKNIFLDCGTHLCEGLVQFYNNGIINDSYEIHTFEANPACNIEERVKQLPLNITFYNVAVWVKDGFIQFNQENHKDSKSGSPTDEYSDIDGWASSVSEINLKWGGYNESIQVKCIDFARFIYKLPEDSNIICKMDIEGSEFHVLRHLIEKDVISKIKEIYIEFHDHIMDSEDSSTKDNLIKQIESFGVKVHQWF